MDGLENTQPMDVVNGDEGEGSPTPVNDTNLADLR